jgi:hypothetical protein
LRANEARLSELAVLKIATIQRNRESIRVRAARDLAENQIPTWKIGNYQRGPTLSAGRIGPRKRKDNDFAGYRFDHAASSSGEFQSRARTDSLSSAPLNPSFFAIERQNRKLSAAMLPGASRFLDRSIPVCS